MDESGVWRFRGSTLPPNWPTGPEGQPEQAALLLAAQSELGGGADVLMSMLEGCGIPAFKSGTTGKVLLGFAGLGVDIYVPQSRLEEGLALLSAPLEDGGEPAGESEPGPKPEESL